MTLIQLTQEFLAILQGVLSHFVTGTASTVTITSDYESVLTQGSLALTTKGNYLSGGFADVLLYGTMTLDWLIQAMLNLTSASNAVPLP
ncbi:MAG: hypothetical protein JRN22_00335 [Nitrososphaerota archaeon]|nr:hypothetical protein [Nitrososphaerota archaeon]